MEMTERSRQAIESLRAGLTLAEAARENSMTRKALSHVIHRYGGRKELGIPPIQPARGCVDETQSPYPPRHLMTEVEISDTYKRTGEDYAGTIKNPDAYYQRIDKSASPSEGLFRRNADLRFSVIGCSMLL